MAIRKGQLTRQLEDLKLQIGDKLINQFDETYTIIRISEENIIIEDKDGSPRTLNYSELQSKYKKL